MSIAKFLWWKLGCHKGSEHFLSQSVTVIQSCFISILTETKNGNKGMWASGSKVCLMFNLLVWMSIMREGFTAIGAAVTDLILRLCYSTAEMITNTCTRIWLPSAVMQIAMHFIADVLTKSYDHSPSLTIKFCLQSLCFILLCPVLFSLFIFDQWMCSCIRGNISIQSPRSPRHVWNEYQTNVLFLYSSMPLYIQCKNF